MYLLASLGNNPSHLPFTGEYYYKIANLFLAFLEMKG